MEKVKFTVCAKNEMLKNQPTEVCCAKAWLAAAVKATGSLNITKTGMNVVFESDDYDYMISVVHAIKLLYSLPVELISQRGKGAKKSAAFMVKLGKSQSETLLFDVGIWGKGEDDMPCFARGVRKEIVRKECCAKAFLRSVFVATGSANVPPKLIGESDSVESSGGGYYLEFVLSDEILAEVVAGLLKSLGVPAKTTERKEKFVVYQKDSEIISNTFALLGAHEAVMYMQEIMVERTLSANLNRQSNSAAANADKTVIAATKQVLAIQTIDKTSGLDKLPDTLKEIAVLRLENPTAGLDFFAGRLGITKSGVNHRFRKLVQMAEEIENKR